MIMTAGVYKSEYEYSGNHIQDTIAFYPTLDGEYVGIGGIDSDNWRMLLHLNESGEGTYLEVNSSTYEKEGGGTVLFKQTDAGIEGEWQSVDEATKEALQGPWKLIYKIGSTTVGEAVN